MRLQEILTESVQLDEDFGNLKEIDPKFQNAIKVPYDARVPHDSEQGYRNVQKYVTLKSLGQNSTVEKVPFKTANAVTKELEKPDVVATVISVEGKQVAIIVPILNKNGISVEHYTIGFDLERNDEVFGNVAPEVADELDPALADLFGSKERSYGGPGRRGTTKHVPAKLEGLEIRRESTNAQQLGVTSAMLKAIKAAGLKAELLVIYKDTKRKSTQSERIQARSGMLPVHKSDFSRQRWENDAKKALNGRLELFKASKAVGVDAIDDMVKAIREKGFLDKIKIDGIAYERGNSHIRLDNLLDKRSKPEENYVEYSMKEGTPEANQYEQDIQDIRAKYRDSSYEERKEKVDEYKKTRPPKKFKVILTLEKGTIVPSDIKEVESYF